MAEQPDCDVVVIGAGFSGLYAMHELRNRMGLRVIGLEAAPDVGGTWYWNRYPGARCDIESIHYSYSFDEQLQQDWTWSERYSAQPEILAYLNHVADRFDLRRDYRFGVKVVSMEWDDDARHWRVGTDRGHEILTRFVVAGTGNVSIPKEPEFNGLESFNGPVYATHAWPHTEPDLAGKRVGIIGTGASGIQAIPKLAERAGHLTVFQRTPNFATPLRNRPSDPEEVARTKANYPGVRAAARDSFLGVPYRRPEHLALEVDPEHRRATYDRGWQTGGFAILMESYRDLLVDEKANDTVAEFTRERIRERVADPAVAEMLCPDDHPLGTKRLPMETDYYETYNRDNVTLVNVKPNQVEAVTPTGLRLADGTEYDLDVLVLATGFDAFTGALTRMGVVGREGQKLNDVWAAGPVSYLGLMTHGFPNLFTITGPGAAVALYNNPLAIEDHVDLATKALQYVLDHGHRTMEPDAQAQAQWREELNERAHATLFPRAASWYMGANIPGKPRVVMMYVGAAAEYRATCAEVVENDWRGFRFD
ncbi:NAD(P)/FAD-dependent oxidoreductase [Pseudonocardia eucalypti]|uniref:NAD(P)/FAD-dependent oxidoreductase n=1 Tax=Pseudonocardia eucalypti TaxID=648755 RepID=A0ABP9Q8A8_9PSEU|nr:cyclohexanone monooxygenase [Pseudonocardia eucalypti]